MSIDKCNISLLPLDSDILSLEIEHFYRYFSHELRNVFLNGDLSLLESVQTSIASLQKLYGEIPNIRAKGNLSSIIADGVIAKRKNSNYKAVFNK